MTFTPDPEMLAARLRFKRRIAAVMVQAMAETGAAFAEMDARIGREPGFCKAYINELIDGGVTGLDEISDLCWAMGCEPVVSARHFAEYATLATKSDERGTGE